MDGCRSRVESRVAWGRELGNRLLQSRDHETAFLLPLTSTRLFCAHAIHHRPRLSRHYCHRFAPRMDEDASMGALDHPSSNDVLPTNMNDAGEVLDQGEEVQQDEESDGEERR
jgi:hypothetical protein